MKYDDCLKAGLDSNIYVSLVTQISKFGLEWMKYNSNLKFSYY